MSEGGWVGGCGEGSRGSVDTRGCHRLPRPHAAVVLLVVPGVLAALGPGARCGRGGGVVMVRHTREEEEEEGRWTGAPSRWKDGAGGSQRGVKPV